MDANTAANTENHEQEKDHIYRVCRKLMDILGTWGNVLVPSIPGEEETFALDSLHWHVKQAEEKFGLTLDDIQKGIDALQNQAESLAQEEQ